MWSQSVEIFGWSIKQTQIVESAIHSSWQKGFVWRAWCDSLPCRKYWGRFYLGVLCFCPYQLLKHMNLFWTHSCSDVGRLRSTAPPTPHKHLFLFSRLLLLCFLFFFFGFHALVLRTCAACMGLCGWFCVHHLKGVILRNRYRSVARVTLREV